MSNLDFDAAADLVGLLAHDRRLIVLQLLMQREWDVNSLAKAVDLSQSALSQHLKKMRDLNVVKVRRDRQTSFYSCEDPGVAKVLSVLEDIFLDDETLTSAA
jgi:DNA-binding transcriptional ArsR family regulator